MYLSGIQNYKENTPYNPLRKLKNKHKKTKRPLRKKIFPYQPSKAEEKNSDECIIGCLSEKIVEENT